PGGEGWQIPPGYCSHLAQRHRRPVDGTVAPQPDGGHSMIPEIDTQLAAVIKSLGDNVLPAVDNSNPLAGEQIRLCLATLGLIKKRLPDLHRYQRHELELNL